MVRWMTFLIPNSYFLKDGWVRDNSKFKIQNPKFEVEYVP